MSETIDSQHIVQEQPNTNNIVKPQQPGVVQLDPHHHIIHVEVQQPGAVQLDPSNSVQQPGAVQLQDRIELHQTILQTEGLHRNHRCRSLEMSETHHEHPTGITGAAAMAQQWKWLRFLCYLFYSALGNTIAQFIKRIFRETHHIVHEHPTIVAQQPGEVQLDPHHHIIHVEVQQPGAVQLDPHDIIHVEVQLDPSNSVQQLGAVQLQDSIGLGQTILKTEGAVQQSGAVQLDPHHHSIQDRIRLDQTILQTEGAYSKITSTIYKLFLGFYGIMQVGILTAVFSSQQRKGLCKDSWGLLVLSAIVSVGVLIAFLWKYCQQFLLLRRGRRLIQEDDSKYWSWITERAAIVIAFMTLSICLWLSCKSRLSC